MLNPGRPLPAHLRSTLESRYGQDFSQVRVHTGSAASDIARRENARAFTTRNDIVFGAGAYVPGTTSGTELIAHELAHVVQQREMSTPAMSILQRQPATQQEVQPSSPADLPPGRYQVIIVGAPGPGEIKAQHPYQFADAAALQRTGSSTVWLVERTGYELGNVALEGVQRRAGSAHVFWITPSTPLATLLRQFPNGSIASLNAYSHGVPGLLALRYGWSGHENYGLSTSQARGLSPEAFASDATLSFDSCNSATTGDDGSLAQAVATSTQRAVQGWIGRTSYRQVNRGTGGVVGSEIWPSGGGFDTTELWSQLRGRAPREVSVAPERSPGDFEGGYEITARLPRTRRFPVGAGQTVKLTITAHSEYAGMQGLSIYVLLHRGDDDIGGSRRFTVGGSATFEWPNLSAGTYHLEIYHLHGVLVTGSVSVRVH
jgi:hypothetical protein